MSYNYQLTFSLFLMIGSLISISSYSWFSMWIGFEINLLAFIPLIQKQNDSLSSESSLKYFMIQTIASSIFLFSMIYLMNFNFFIKNIDKMIILLLNSSLFIKIGMAPFHYWFPEICEGLNWMNCFILLSWQKIAPMILIMYNFNYQYMIFILIILNMLIAGISSFNQVSLRKIMVYSSMNHMAWMISSMFFSEKIWLFYWIIYSILTFNILIFFKILNIFYLNQLISSMNKNFFVKFLFSLNLLSISGLPPFLGFYPKWLTIQYLINFKWIFMTFLMTIFTLLLVFIYLRMILNIFSLINFEINYFSFMPKKINIIILINIWFILSMSFIFMNFTYL